jgi:hypothetical protein
MSENLRDRTEDSVLHDEIADEALERAAYGKAITTNPTVPSAIICIPFEKP